MDQMNDPKGDEVKTPRFLILLLLLMGAFGVMGGGLVAPGLPTIGAAFDAPESQIGLILGLYTLAAALSLPFIGYFIDSVGRKKVGLTCLIIDGVGGIAIIFAPNFTALLIMRFLQGIGIAGLLPVGMTVIGDLFEGEKRLEIIGFLAASIGLSAVIIPFMGGILVSIDWRLPFLVYGFSLFLAVFMYFVLPETKPKEPKAKIKLVSPIPEDTNLVACQEVFQNSHEDLENATPKKSECKEIGQKSAEEKREDRPLAMTENEHKQPKPPEENMNQSKKDSIGDKQLPKVPLVSYLKSLFATLKIKPIRNVIIHAFVLYFMLYALIVYGPIYLMRHHEFTEFFNGIALSTQALFAAALSSRSAKIAKRLEWHQRIGIGYFLMGISFLLLPLWTQGSLLVIVSFMLYGIGMGFVSPTIYNRVTHLAPPELSGAVISIFNTMKYFGMTASPLIIARFLQFMELQAIFPIVAVLAVCWAFFTLIPRFRK